MIPRPIVLLTLGSNIEPETNLLAALDALDARLGLADVSPIYEAEPVGAPGTPKFLNAAARTATDLPPARLKRDVLRPIEAALGRVRGPDRNAPRTIDIDIALVEGLVLDDPDTGMRLPDPDILRHAHVLIPLADVAPDLLHPTEGEPLRVLAARISPPTGLRRRGDLRWPRTGAAAS